MPITQSSESQTRGADAPSPVRLSVVIPCYNEQKTLEACLARVLAIADDSLELEIIIVDDASTDGSRDLAFELQDRHSEVVVYSHQTNQGKGAALRTGFRNATGDYVVVQDADLEYDPTDLPKLLQPLVAQRADVVFGSRFLSSGAHRVLYFWHSLGNRFLTLLSNLLTDLNLTDMEVCYKMFRRDVIQSIDIQEDRFGFEPEIVAKVAHRRLRVYEVGISYYGRTYAEGKKIGWKDGVRALYCIFHYNLPHAPVPIQFCFYTLIGGVAALANLLIFLAARSADLPVEIAAPTAFILAAVVNYLLCIWLLFRHKARWSSGMEVATYIGVVLAGSVVDLGITKGFLALGASEIVSKLVATVLTLIFNFLGRRFLVFAQPSSGAWR